MRAVLTTFSDPYNAMDSRVYPDTTLMGAASIWPLAMARVRVRVRVRVRLRLAMASVRVRVRVRVAMVNSVHLYHHLPLSRTISRHLPPPPR